MAAPQTDARLAERARAGDPAALGRLLTRIIDVPGVLARVLPRRVVSPAAEVVGFTGSPGVGKSSLISAVIDHLRGAGERVAVLCVDPSSPFSGGAVLGDRIRMRSHGLDASIFIRSFASRGETGGLAQGIPAAAVLLREVGFTQILIETVGVGQNETAIHAHAATSIVVMAPAMGDSIQAMKGGLLEIADVLAVNKSDLGGSQEAILHLRQGIASRSDGWIPPVIPVSALENRGIAELWQLVEAHRVHWATHQQAATTTGREIDAAVTLASDLIARTAREPDLRDGLISERSPARTRSDLARTLLRMTLERDREKGDAGPQ